MSDHIKCAVKDGLHVLPCKWLEKATDGRGSSGRERGLRLFDYTRHGVPTRTFYAIKSGEFPKTLAIYFCPWCGTDISAPFAAAERESNQDQGTQS